MANSTTEQDFFQIKENLKDYMRDQSDFADYDFDGSAMSNLLDVLAYNTHYSAITANMSANEMFLDTAQLRHNVVSHAKALGYTPQSTRAATSTITITGSSTSTSPVTMARGTVFSSSGDTAYKFITLKDYTATPVAGAITFSNVVVYQGKLLTNSFTVTDGAQEFVIPNKQCDTSSMRVTVSPSATSTDKITYTLSTGLGDNLTNSKVYFLDEVNESVKIYFGDNLIGKKLDTGNVVKVEYLKTDGIDGNSISTLALTSVISGVTSVGVAASKTSGGTGIETIKSIKTNAPFNYAAQNRAVTTDDYKVIIKKVYPNTKSISVWGGEDNNPAVYGKVFASIKPASGSFLTNETKEYIKTSLNRYKVASIIPEIVDPDYLYLMLDVSFKYDSGLSSLTSSELETKVQKTVTDYDTNVLNEFSGLYRNSNLTSLVDETDKSIISSTIRHSVKKLVPVKINEYHSYLIEFSNAIYHPHSGHSSVLSSNGFHIDTGATVYYLSDDGAGKVSLYHTPSGSTAAVIDDANFGTIDYSTGQINITKLKIVSFASAEDSELTITTSLSSHDIVPVRNVILNISSVTINSSEDTSKSGTYSGNANYETTPARL